MPEELLAVRKFNPFAVDYRYDEVLPDSESLDRADLLAQVRRCVSWAEAEVGIRRP